MDDPGNDDEGAQALNEYDTQGLYESMQENTTANKDIRENIQLLKDLPEFNSPDINNELLKNLRTHITTLIDKLDDPIPSNIKNQKEAEEASLVLQDIEKKFSLIASIPNDIKNIENTATIIKLLEKDIEFLRNAKQEFGEKYRQILHEYNKALQRVKRANELHETRSTTNILKGNQNVSEHFFNQTPTFKKKNEYRSNIPWQIADNKIEDNELEKAIKESNIKTYLSENNLIPNTKELSLDEMLEILNQKLIKHNIKLYADDEELHEKIKHLILSNTLRADKHSEEDSDKEDDNASYFTPKSNRDTVHKDTTNLSKLDNSLYYTPNENTRHYPNISEEPNSKHHNITTMQDLARFQREANFPSVRSKVITQTPNKNQKQDEYYAMTLDQNWKNTAEMKIIPSGLQKQNLQESTNISKDHYEVKPDQKTLNKTRYTSDEQFKDYSTNRIIEETLPNQYDKLNIKENTHENRKVHFNTLPYPNIHENKEEKLMKTIRNKVKKLEVEMDNLEESTATITRIINRIKNIENFTFQELQDLSQKLIEYNKTAKNHRKLQIEFKKELIDIEDSIKEYEPELHKSMTEAGNLAGNQAKELANVLRAAEDKILDEKVSNSNLSALDAKQIEYFDFSGAANEKNIFEVLRNHENNHKLNRTSNYLKGIILKKHLKGNAKLTIADDVTSFEEIKTALIKRYGNVNELLASLYNQHSKVGPTPPKTGSAVQWAKINEVCKAHITLLRRADLLLKHANNSVINEKYVVDLIKFLPQEDRYEVLSTKDDPEFAYKTLKNKFNITLDMSQEMIRLNPKQNTTIRKRNEEPTTGNSEFGLVTSYEVTIAKDCRICAILQEQGNMQGFFENHLQNKHNGSFYNSQCPLYLKMDMEHRLKFLRENQICVYCVNPINVSHNIDLCRQKNLNIRNGRQPPFTCRSIGCPNRLELCIIHKDSNMEALLRRKENLSKNNIEMCLVTWKENEIINDIDSLPDETNPDTIQKVNQWLDQIALYTDTQNNAMKKKNTETTKCNSNERPLLVKHKETLLNQQDVTALTNQSKPLFMFMKLKGHNRGINTMFDSGSSAVVCTDAIPGKELKACRIQNQAIELQGLGASKRKAQAWTILLPILQNRFVATTAYSVPHILGPLSPIDLKPAHQMIKETAVNNEEVQRSQIYDYLAGNIELLAGIRLNSLFPEKIFQMTNGLALYKLKLASHDNHKTFCLGGPYEMINEMNKIFKESAHFLNEIEVGLDQWRSGNTATIPINYELKVSPKNTKIFTGVIANNEDITQEELEEIDNFLDEIYYDRHLLNNKMSKTNDTIQLQDMPLDEKGTEKESTLNIMIEINKYNISTFLKNIQQEVLHHNPNAEINQIRQNIFIQLMTIKIADWNTTIVQLKEECKKMKLPTLKINLQKEYQITENHKVILLPTKESKLKIEDLQQSLNINLNKIPNILVINNNDFKAELFQVTNGCNLDFVKNIQQKQAYQIVKEIKIFRQHIDLNETRNKIVYKIRFKGKNKDTNKIEESVNISQHNLIPTVNIANEEKGNKTKTNDITLLKNIDQIIDGIKVGYRCTNCANCNKCKQNPNQGTMTMKEQLEEYLIEKSVQIDRNNKHFVAKLPLIQDPEEALLPNITETRTRLKKVLQKLKKNEEDSMKIKEAFGKLIELGYVIKTSDLPKQVQDKIASKIKYHIPWDYVSKPTSITTEKRQVYDASAKTMSGNSLNDILSKGCPKLEFDSAILNFMVNKFGMCGDLMKFYQSVKLHEDHYNLQLILWTDSMDPEDEPSEYVITRLTFGLKSSSQQLEHCIDLLAEENKQKKDLYRILKHQRFVDDIMGSYDCKEKINSLKKEIDSTLQNYGMKVKGYACSYEKPPLNISDGISLATGGYIWHPELDILFIRIQPLHYGEKRRGKILTEEVFLDGTLQDLEQFVPEQITLRQVLSRGAQVFDPLGLVNPWKTGVKILTRESLESVKKDWDAPLSSELRNRWIKKFWDMQELKRIGFKRCNLPLNCNVLSMSLICFCDAGKHAKVQIVYLLHEIKKEIYFPQLLYSKSQLIQTNKTLANMELDSLNNGAELLNKCYQAIPKIDRICLVGDSQITSYWIAKDTISLATFQRNRVSNIRRLIDIKDIYRCKGTDNVADIGTKGETNLSESIPGSKFHCGPNWLKHGIDNSIALGHIIPITKTKIDPSDTETWKLATDGLVGKCKWPDELLTKGDKHKEIPILAINHQWVNQVKERYDFSQYIIDPLKKSWTQSVRILATTYYFIHCILIKKIKKTEQKKNKHQEKRWRSIHSKLFDFSKETEHKIFCQTFTTMITNESPVNIPTDKMDEPIQMCEQIKRSPMSLIQAIKSINKSIQKNYFNTNQKANKKQHILDLFGDGIIANFFKNIAILYFLKKGAAELGAFYNKGMLKKHCYKQGMIYFSKNRWLETNQLRILDEGNISIQDLQIQEMAPVLDRFSPVAIALALHFHNKVTKHAGADRSHLAIQGSIFILQGQKLFEDICRDCITCRIKLKQRYTQIMGPIAKEQITFSAVGRFIFLDMSGPYETKSGIYARSTRKNTGKVKTWLLHGVCIVSNYSTVQVLENYATDAFVQAVHRMASYFGYPQIAFIDSSQTEIKGLTKTKFSMYDARNQLYDECGITIRLCGVGPQSHARHGVIERRIALFKKYFELSKQSITDLTPIGLYTLALQAASHLNASPLCSRKRNGSTISSRLITPNCFFLGKRSNFRAPADIPLISEDRSQMMDNLLKAAEGMFSFFRVNIPDLLLRSCWTDEPKKEIQKGDLVLFTKEESAITSTWKLGIVYELEKDEDDKARIFQITYVNKDEITLPLEKDAQVETSITKRITRKGAHTIVKIHSVDDNDINRDLAYLNTLLNNNENNKELPEETAALVFAPQPVILQSNLE